VPSLGKLEARASGAGEHRLEVARDAAGAAQKGVPPAVIAARFLVLALAAGAVVAGWALARRAPRARIEAGAARYACPMHREIASAVEGQCPVCGMRLEPVEAAAALHPPPGWLRRGSIDQVRRRIFQYEIADPARVEDDGSVHAVLYADELEALAPGELLTFRASGNQAVSAQVQLAGEARPWDHATEDVRLEVIDPAFIAAVITDHFAQSREVITDHVSQRRDAIGAHLGSGLSPGTAGWVFAPPRPHPVLVVPSSAVLQSSDGPYVLALSPDLKMVERRRVKIGRTFLGLCAVVSGLAEQEPLVARGAFFLDAALGQRSAAGMAVDP